MTTRSDATRQWSCKQDRDNLTLVPPLAEEFQVYGGKDTVERARQWALDGRYLLADGVPACAHGLYLLASCPGAGTCRSNFRQLDHASVWVPAEVSDRPFLLCHPYASSVEDETLLYARAHGLQTGSYPEFGDGWYGTGALPVRLTISPSWPVWPIERKAAVLLSTQPVTWPGDEAAR